MEKRDPLVLDTHEIAFVTEAIEARVSQLQAFLPSEWRDSRLRFLNSFMEQLMEHAQLEQALPVGMDQQAHHQRRITSVTDVWDGHNPIRLDPLRNFPIVGDTKQGT